MALLALVQLAALVVEHVEGRLLARPQRDQVAAPARRLLFQHAQRGKARRRSGADQPGALAMRALAGGRLQHAGAQPPAAHLHQAEAPNPADLYAGAVVLHPPLPRLLYLVVVGAYTNGIEALWEQRG